MVGGLDSLRELPAIVISISKQPQRPGRYHSGFPESHHRLANLPDGYLRKMTSAEAIHEAMDRLYREVRLGVVGLAMARALLDILNRLEERLAKKEAKRSAHPKHTAALRPKLVELIAQEERTWSPSVDPGVMRVS